MKNKKMLIIFSVVLILIVGVVVWWLVFQKRNNDNVPKDLYTVKLKLKWTHQAQFAGNYMAIEKGFYKNEGLSVELIPFSYEDTAIEAVVGGRADFGIAGADEVILARAEGKSVKAIAVIYKVSPVVAYVLKTSGIDRPQDFIGKTVGLQKGVNTEYLYFAMMKKLGIDRSKIKEVAIGYDARELTEGKVDVSTGYLINEPHLAMEAGFPVNMILMADYGVNMYADVLFTTDEMIKTKPEIVEKMLKSTLAGWQYAIEHEQEAVNVTLEYATNSTKSHETYMLSTSVPLINLGLSKLGWMELSAWEQAQNILFEQKLLKNKIEVSQAFTMDFLEAVYKEK
jgi:NitT/TauT family transport system substrate-binding protein